MRASQVVNEPGDDSIPLADILGSAPASITAPQRGKRCPECGLQLMPGAGTCPSCGCDADMANLDVGDELPAFVDKEIRRAKGRAAKAPPDTARKRKRTFMIGVGVVTGLVVIGISASAIMLMSGAKGKEGAGAAADKNFLILDWAELDRSPMIKLYINGKEMKVPQEGPVGGPLAAGKHRVKLDCGFGTPAEQEVDLAPGETVRLKVRVLGPGQVSLEAPAKAAGAPAAKGQPPSGESAKPAAEPAAKPGTKPAAKPGAKPATKPAAAKKP